jgi:hypothetical protein
MQLVTVVQCRHCIKFSKELNTKEIVGDTKHLWRVAVCAFNKGKMVEDHVCWHRLSDETKHNFISKHYRCVDISTRSQHIEYNYPGCMDMTVLLEHNFQIINLCQYTSRPGSLLP